MTSPPNSSTLACAMRLPSSVIAFMVQMPPNAFS
jgi:hypothetical protein